MRNEKEEETGSTFSRRPSICSPTVSPTTPLSGPMPSTTRASDDSRSTCPVRPWSAGADSTSIALCSASTPFSGFHQHLEYKPLVNSQAHQLGKDRRILNDRLRTIRRYLSVLKFHPELGDEDLLAVSYYLLLQDRGGRRAELLCQGTQGKNHRETPVRIHGHLCRLLHGATGIRAPTGLQVRRLSRRPLAKPFPRGARSTRRDRWQGIKPVDDEDREQVQGVLASSEPGSSWKSKREKSPFMPAT